MKTAITFACVVAVATAARLTHTDYQWEEWKTEHGKSYRRNLIDSRIDENSRLSVCAALYDRFSYCLGYTRLGLLACLI